MSDTTIFRQRAATKIKRILLPEQHDTRVSDAAKQLQAQGIVKPVFLHPSSCTDTSNIEVFSDIDNSAQWQQQALDSLASSLIKKGKRPGDAAAMIENNPLLLGALLLKLGYVDSAVCGSIASTGDVLRAGIRGVGLDTPSGIVSSCFLIQLAGHSITFGDCAVIPHPNSEQLAKIAIACATTHQTLTGEEPKIAMLSFSTKGSASDASIDKINAAIELVKQQAPHLNIDGELQFDAAFVPWIGKKKAPSSTVAGHANIFIFPDLQSGNIGYKIAERIGNARAIGPITQGFNKPWLDLSRGCSLDDIVDTAAIASLLAN